MSPSMTFSEALTQAAAQANRTLDPALASRISAATELVRAGHCFEASDGTWQVGSTSSEGLTYSVNGSCDCNYYYYNKQTHGLCKHRIAMFLSRRVLELMQPPAPVEPAHDREAPPRPTAPCAAAAAEHSTLAAPALNLQNVPQQHIVMIQGRPFIRYAGLLDLAHQRGLVALTADWTYNDGELSLAHAVATFQDGRRFEESGDAAPANTNRTVAVHFRRVALTRAKARVLRDALGVDLVAVEELADE